MIRSLLMIGLGLALFAVNALGEDSPAPMPAEDVARTMQLPEGFRASVFAAEPDVVQPIAFTLDDRGRLWVVECLAYPNWQAAGGPGKDRVSIFEDQDGDGQFDSKKIFLDSGRNLSGIELGFGGVWLCSTPNLIFIPDNNGDDKPDGPPEVLLDGWSLEAKHNVFNGLTWGPDGWLYGLNGILATSFIGKPGTPDDQRIAMNCGVWRIHPITKQFEVVMHGTTNPWGLDYDDNGQFFITNCVIKHLFHVIPGAHTERMYGQDLNPHVYQLMTSCADYLHWGGGPWQESRSGEGIHDGPGGGHAHAGCMIYLGDNWPEEYRGRLFTCNIHGRRVNSDGLNLHGSGYKSERKPDFLKVPDPWFRGLELKYGPDGGVYMTDWSDTGECHDYEDIHRENGRIYKITYGKIKNQSLDLARLSNEELLNLLGHENAWHARHAGRLLHERAAARELPAEFVQNVQGEFEHATGRRNRLRLLWLLHGIHPEGIEEALATELLSDPDPFVRGWAIQLSLEDKDTSAGFLEKLVQRAQTDESQTVRLFLASALQRLPLKDRWDLASALLSHEQDANDANLPLLIWYGIEPLVDQDRTRALRLVVQSKIPLVRQHIARRAATVGK